MQSNLNKWLNLKDINLPKNFYWKWGQNAIWTDQDYEGSFRIEINWKEYNHKVILIGDFPEDQEYKLEETIDEEFKISIMKSHIQKCIRRKLHIKAVRSSYHLLTLDFNHFIRRINIIMLEDTILMDSYNNLIWMMLAYSTKTWNPLNIHIQWILGVVHNLCEIDDVLEYDKNNLQRTELYLDDLDQGQKSLIYSMQIRKSYGGMKGDTEMIQAIINDKIKKFKNDEQILKIPVRRVSLIMQYLPFKHYELSSIDFHCVPYIIDKVIEKYPRLYDQQVKSLIWKYRSGINFRNSNVEKSNEYKKIEKFLENFSSQILKKL
jgi:hypothetical protein